jgi:hypothetical protein
MFLSDLCIAFKHRAPFDPAPSTRDAAFNTRYDDRDLNITAFEVKVLD